MGLLIFLLYKTRHYVLFTEPTIIKVNANELSPYGNKKKVFQFMARQGRNGFFI